MGCCPNSTPELPPLSLFQLPLTISLCLRFVHDRLREREKSSILADRALQFFGFGRDVVTVSGIIPELSDDDQVPSAIANGSRAADKRGCDRFLRFFWRRRLTDKIRFGVGVIERSVQGRRFRFWCAAPQAVAAPAER